MFIIMNAVDITEMISVHSYHNVVDLENSPQGAILHMCVDIYMDIVDITKMISVQSVCDIVTCSYNRVTQGICCS